MSPLHKQRKRTSSGQFSGLYRMLVLDIVMPLIVVQVGLHTGFSPLIALAAAALFPLADALVGIVQSRAVGIVAAVTLVGIVAGIVLAYVTGNALFAILKDSALTFLFSLVFFGSLATTRPLTFRLYRQMLSEGSRVSLDTTWAGAIQMRRAFRLMTFVWGLGLLTESLLRVTVSLVVPVRTAAAASPVIAFIFIGGLILWTVVFARKLQRASVRRGLAV